MMRARELLGRAVIDLTTAKKLGQIDELVLDPVGRQVAGFVIGRGPSLVGAAAEHVVPASAVHALGPDAVTVRGAAGVDLAGLPRLGQIVGRKMVTEGGVLLGTIGDVLVEPTDGRIVGYAIGGDRGGMPLAGLFGGRNDEAHAGYVRADADLVVGDELVVVPDDAVVRDGGAPPLRREDAAPTVFGWPDPPHHAAPVGPGQPSLSGSSIDSLSGAPLPPTPPPAPVAAQLDPPPAQSPAPARSPIEVLSDAPPAPAAPPADLPLDATQPLPIERPGPARPRHRAD
jgi:sporulation protein YlmC with PRC-barrel domain